MIIIAGIFQLLIPSSILLKNPGQCETNPHAEMSHFSAAFFEFCLTTLLILLICSVTDIRNSTRQDSGAIKFGLTIAALSFAGVCLKDIFLRINRHSGFILKYIAYKYVF